jgi:hypothetical protein
MSFKSNTVRKAPTVFLQIIKTKICVREDLNLSGWIVDATKQCDALGTPSAECCSERIFPER